MLWFGLNSSLQTGFISIGFILETSPGKGLSFMLFREIICGFAIGCYQFAEDTQLNNFLSKSSGDVVSLAIGNKEKEKEQKCYFFPFQLQKKGLPGGLGLEHKNHNTKAGFGALPTD